MSFRSRTLLNFVFLAVVIGGVSGCGLFQSDNRTEEQKRESEQKTRDEVAKATEKAKPELQKAGRELKGAAKTAAQQAHAAAQGVKEGWERSGKRGIDLNSASESELMNLPGIRRRDARKIGLNPVSLHQVWRLCTTIARCARIEPGGNIPCRRRIISSRRFCVGFNWVGFAGDVATRIRRVSRYHWGHSRSARISTYLDYYALPAWANGSLTGTTSQTKQLGS